MAFTTLPTSAYSTLDATKLTGNLPALNGASLTGVGGLTEVDTWRLTTTFSGEQNWGSMERVDTDASGHIGTGLSYSSPNFSFPSTGFYLLQIQGNFYKSSTGQRLISMSIQFTTNNNDYTEIGYSRTQIADETSSTENMYTSVYSAKLFDITDISNQKFRIASQTNNDTNVKTLGNTDDHITGFTIMKLGDT